MPASQRIKIHKWEPRAPDDRRPLPVLYDGRAELPDDHDAARLAARDCAVRLVSRVVRVRACSALVGGGFAIVVETRG